MMCIKRILILSVILLGYFNYPQVTPFYGLAKVFYVGEASIMHDGSTASYTVTNPSGFLTSTASHRHPFHAVTYATNQKFENN